MVKKKEFNVFHAKTWKFINTKSKVFHPGSVVVNPLCSIKCVPPKADRINR